MTLSIDMLSQRDNTHLMKDPRQNIESEKATETATREPFFRRYQIRIKAGVRAGAVPTGHPPIGY
jgi:hypothetical protein